MFKISFWIHDLPKNFEADSAMPDVMTLTNNNSYIAITPPDRYWAYGSVKIPFRKTAGNADKIIVAFKKYVDRLYDIVNQQIAEGNIHKDFVEIVSNKI